MSPRFDSLTGFCAKPPLFGVSQMGAPQGGFSCPFGAIHLQVAERSEVGGGGQHSALYRTTLGESAARYEFAGV